MSDKSEHQVQVDRIRNAVLSKYEGSKEICIRKAVKRWQETRFDPNETEPVGELHHTTTSPELEELAIAWHHADIEENAALARLELAQLKVRDAKYRFISALAEFEGICVNSDDLYVVIPRLEVWKSDPEKLRRILPYKVVAFCQNLCEGKLDPETTKGGHFPQDLKEMQVLGDFVNDFLGFLDENGDKGKNLGKAICSDSEIAKTVSEDEQVPKPVRFLADQALKVSADLPRKDPKNSGVGFGAVRRMY